MEIRKLIWKVGSAILTGLWTLSSVLDVVDRYNTGGSQVLSNLASAPYELIVVLAGLTAFPLWLGYQIHAWRVSKEPRVKVPTAETERIKPTAIASAPEVGQELGFELRARRHVPDVDTLLKAAKENGQVWVMGIDCSHWLTGFPEKIRESVRARNLSFTFLLAAEGTKNMELAESAKLISPQSDVTHSRCVESFNSIRSGSGNTHKLRLGIYDLPLVHSMVVVNPNTEDEQIVVTHHVFNVDPLERPSLVLKRAHLSNQLQVVFDQYRKSIDHVMRNAKDEGGKSLETEPERTYVKLGFQTQIKRDLLEIESQLNFEKPKPIHFKSWDETETGMRKQLIDNETVYGIVENIAKVLNEWNKDLDRASLLMVRPSSQTYIYIQSCRKYYQKLREIGFLS